METLTFDDNYDIIRFNTLEGKKLYGIYKKNRTSFSTIVNSLFRIYSCKNVSSDKMFFTIPNERIIDFNDYDRTPEQLVITNKSLINICTSTETYGFYKELTELEYNMMKAKLDKGDSSIFVKCLTGKTIALPFHPDVTVNGIAHLIKDREGIPCDQHFLIFQGKQLIGDLMMKDYGIEKYSTLHLVLRLRGGMYHETSGKDGNYQDLKDCLFIVPSDEEFKELPENEITTIPLKN